MIAFLGRRTGEPVVAGAVAIGCLLPWHLPSGARLSVP
jgi:hypothetical protein